MLLTTLDIKTLTEPTQRVRVIRLNMIPFYQLIQSTIPKYAYLQLMALRSSLNVLPWDVICFKILLVGLATAIPNIKVIWGGDTRAKRRRERGGTLLML